MNTSKKPQEEIIDEDALVTDDQAYEQLRAKGNAFQNLIGRIEEKRRQAAIEAEARKRAKELQEQAARERKNRQVGLYEYVNQFLPHLAPVFGNRLPKEFVQALAVLVASMPDQTPNPANNKTLKNLIDYFTEVAERS